MALISLIVLHRLMIKTLSSHIRLAKRDSIGDRDFSALRKVSVTPIVNFQTNLSRVGKIIQFLKLLQTVAILTQTLGLWEARTDSRDNFVLID
jgi:hypothetical protein